MKIRPWLTFLLLISPILIFGQAIQAPPAVGAKMAGLGQAYTAVRGDFWSLFKNPAGIAGIQSAQLGIYAEQRYFLEELTYGSAGLVIPFLEEQAIGLQVGSFGFEAYRENHASFTYAIEIFDIVSIGAKANYANVNITDYGSSSTFFLDIGLNAAINQELSIGFYAFNANRASLQTQSFEEELPMIIATGISYLPTEKVMFVIDIQKELESEVSFRGGIDYGIADFLFARLGVSTEPLIWSGGFGLIFDNFFLDAALTHHERLGYSPHLSLSYAFGRSE